MKVKRRFAAFLAAAMVLCVCGFAAGENPPSGEMNVFRMMTPGPGDSGVAYPLFSFAGGMRPR